MSFHGGTPVEATYRAACGAVIVLAAALLCPSVARAQASLSGLVEDATGAVLPGVTVEASSPALIEKVRSAITDSAGRYTIVDLRPGTYAVMFTLPGFNSMRREGIELAGASATQVNAVLKVGAIEETVTVSGQTPVVDVQRTQQQTVVNREMLEVLPGGRSLAGRLDVLPGVNASSIHGSLASETWAYNDGVRTGLMYGSGSTNIGPQMNEAAAAELTFDTGAQSAELQTGGIRMNAIPREGGNTYAGTMFAYGANSKMSSDNRTEELRPLLRDPNRLAYIYEFNPAVGGPILKDKLWFFGGAKTPASKTFVAGTYFEDGRQAYTASPVDGNWSALMRLTYQMTQRDKLRVVFERNSQFVQYGSVGNLRADPPAFPATQPETSFDIKIPVGYHTQLKWTRIATSRLLLEARIANQFSHWMHVYQPGTGPFDIPRSEITIGSLTGRGAAQRRDEPSNRKYADASASYVTGSHALKFGIAQVWGWLEHRANPNADIVSLNFLTGQPSSITIMDSPVMVRQEVHRDVGLYAQDTWTLRRRLTLNLGARYDHFNSGLPEQTAPAGNFVPARTFAPVENVPNWNDWAVRLGVSYDLFGDGRTAIKGSVSKYVAGESTQLVTAVNPMQIQMEQRSWDDRDRNGTVLDANNRIQYEEIGPTRNLNFGLPTGLRADPALPRGYEWEQTVALTHELRPGVAVTGGYYRRQYYNLQWTHNLLVNPDVDFTPFPISAPVDPRLPNGGGEIITMYNLAQPKLGQVDNLIEASPINTRAYHGFEASVNARLPNGGFLLGGVTTQRTATNSCSVNDPNQRRFCENVPPFRTLVKASGMYPLPYSMHISANVSFRPGNSIGATYSVNSAIAGVPLTGGGTLSVQLVEPNTLFYDYQKQVDLRLDRTFRFDRWRVTAFGDVYNLLNLSTVTSVNQVYGPNWLRPNGIVQARYVRLGAQLDF